MSDPAAVLEKFGIRITDPKQLEDPEVVALLGEYDATLGANPLEGYLPHSKQQPFHAARVRTKVFLGGNRSGKSTAGVVDDLIQAVDEDCLPDSLKPYKIWQPPFYCRIVTPDFTRTLKAVSEAIRRWCPRDQFKGGSWEKAYRHQEKVFELANGSFFEFLTYEQDIDKFGGSARHRVHFDEEPDGEKGEEVREECSMRLIDFKGDELFTFTPLNGLGWTYDEFEEEKGQEVKKDVWLNDTMVVIRSDMDDNPALDKDEIEFRLSKLPEKQRSARKSGNFEHFKGLVYEMYDPELHVVPKPDREHVQGLETFVGIDPGMQTTAILFGGFDKDNSVLFYDEIRLSDTDAIPENAVERIRTVEQRWGVTPRYYLIDPSARNRNLSDAQRVQRLYQLAGIPAYEAQNDVEAGVFEVQRRLENRDGEGNPAPLLRIAENCTNLRKEKSRYRLDIQEDGKFKVVKREDHFCDSERYICAARPLPLPSRPKPAHRRERFVPGTAPPFKPEMPSEAGPMGRFA